MPSGIWCFARPKSLLMCRFFGHHGTALIWRRGKSALIPFATVYNDLCRRPNLLRMCRKKSTRACAASSPGGVRKPS